MYRRVVKPPPKVSPGLPSAVSHQAPSVSHAETQDEEFEALVRAEMAKLEADLKLKAPITSIVHEDHRSHPMSKQEYHPQSSLDYPSNFDIPHDSPRRAKGGLNDLYGPSDDRQNLKAAKAAAYSHQVHTEN